MHIDRLGIADLRLLVTLYEMGTLSAAADRLGLSQPTASHALKRMRNLLKDPLFARTPTGMRPTPYGSRICTAAREALHTIDTKLGVDTPFEASTSTRKFSMYLSDIGQMVFLPKLLSALKQAAPNITLHVRSVPPYSAGELMKTGEVDLAVGHFTDFGTGFVQRPMFREQYVCVARADHPAFADGMTLEAFNSVPHATADATGMAHHLLNEALARQHLSQRVQLFVPQFMVMPLIIRSSDLLVIMPSRLAEQFAQLVPLKLMPLPGRVPSYDIKLYWHENLRRNVGHRWLRELLVKLFSESEAD